ncbi:hypothetical protein CHU98_g1392 [Xylaria longipes]|nr:hypothetical protein CHU98_g1392 [Xylaria longipes]
MSSDVDGTWDTSDVKSEGAQMATNGDPTRSSSMRFFSDPYLYPRFYVLASSDRADICTGIDLDEEGNEESHFGEYSNGLIVDDTALQSYPLIKSSYEMLALTISLAGSVNLPIQVTDIGISPTVIASVWIIPPLCGATLQPLFGIWSDILKEKVGRRELFVLLGGIGLICALLIQAWNSTITIVLDGSCGGTRPACRAKIFVSVFAVVVLYASAQAVQVGTRVKMVDECHLTQQLDVNTWASRVISLTSVLYYILSYGLPPLTTVELRMQELALISAIIIVGAISTACTSQKKTNGVRGRGEGNTTERLGPLALFLQSVVHLTTSLILPSLIGHNTRNANSTTVAFNIPKFEPIQIWRLSQALYSAFVAGILLTNSTDLMLALAAMTGLCWAVMQIIPYTMLTDEFIKRNDADYRKLSRSGLFLGINNLSMTIPQVIAGFICTTIFSTVSERHTNSLSNGHYQQLELDDFHAAVSFLVTLVTLEFNLMPVTLGYP